MKRSLHLLATGLLPVRLIKKATETNPSFHRRPNNRKPKACAWWAQGVGWLENACSFGFGLNDSQVGTAGASSVLCPFVVARRAFRCKGIVFLAVLAIAAAEVLAASGAEPQNLALDATITANSEYSDAYVAKGVADGQIPPAGSKADLRKAWCVKGSTHRNGAELVFEWPKPVTVREIVYYEPTHKLPSGRIDRQKLPRNTRATANAARTMQCWPAKRSDPSPKER